jgi:hypothetical protein
MAKTGDEQDTRGESLEGLLALSERLLLRVASLAQQLEWELERELLSSSPLFARVRPPHRPKSAAGGAGRNRRALALAA